MNKPLKTRNRMVQYTKNQLEKLKSKTDFTRLDKMSDDDIDYSDLPRLDNKFFLNAKVIDHTKTPISLRVDSDVLDWFKHQQGRYQKLINQVLRQYMIAHRHHS